MPGLVAIEDPIVNDDPELRKSGSALRGGGRVEKLDRSPALLYRRRAGHAAFPRR
jgi:hypothetical protein